MKQTKIIFILLLIASGQFVFAQSGSWSKAGNSLAGTEKFGSSNTKPINFFTNNTQRMTLSSIGLLGIGTKTPKVILHVFKGSGAGITDYNQNSTLVTESSADNFISVFAPETKRSGIFFGNTDNGTRITYNDPNAPRALQFRASFNNGMTLSEIGNLGIGTEGPAAKLHVFNGTSGSLKPNPNSLIIMENFGDGFFSMLTPLNNRSGFLFANSLNAADGGILFNDPSTKRGLQFRTGGNVTRLVIANTGAVGIGTGEPTSDLHVFHGKSGIAPLAGSTIVTENSADNFISLLTPAANKSAVLFGTSQNNQDGAIVYNNPATPRGFQINAAGITRLTVTNDGFIGINTITPKSELHLRHGNSESNGLRLENNVNGKNWTLSTFQSGLLGLTFNGATQGFFENNGGDYVSLSDIHQKKGIEKATDVMEKVLKLDIKKYHFLHNSSTDPKHYGMIAQEVEKVFPEIVRQLNQNGQTISYVNYNAYGIIAIKGLQEQQKKITALEERIEKQDSIINDFKLILDQLHKLLPLSGEAVSPENIHTLPRNGRLFQNTPNPFRGNTIIRYYLPENNHNATLEIIAANGNLHKAIPLSQEDKGQVNLNTNELSPGIYIYALNIDGVRIDAKRMVVTK